MKFEHAKRNPPRISARFWDEFKQRLLSNFFTAKASTSSASLHEIVQTESVLQSSSIEASSSSQPEQHDDLSLAELTGSSQNLPGAVETSTSLRPATSSTKNKRCDHEPQEESRKKKRRRKVEQTKISSFFAKPPGKGLSSVSRSSSAATIIDVDEGEVETKQQPDESSQSEADHKLALSLSEATGLTDVSTSSSFHSKAAWGHLLAPLRPPVCKTHGEPCKEFTVGKPGPNKGKKFFICSR